MPFELPEDLLDESFLASTGPGGQNVNKVATACQLRVDVHRLGLPLYAYRKLKVLAGSKLTVAGELVVTAREHRTREANRAEARARIVRLIDQAFVREAPRIKTKPSRAAKAKRIDAKKGRGEVKKNRGKVRID
jgi:ribosome-associated protein